MLVVLLLHNLSFCLARGRTVQTPNGVSRAAAIVFCTLLVRASGKYKYETVYQGLRRSPFVLCWSERLESTNAKRCIKGCSDRLLYFAGPSVWKVQIRNGVSRAAAIAFCTLLVRASGKYKRETVYQGLRRSPFVLCWSAHLESTNAKRCIKGCGDRLLYFHLPRGRLVQTYVLSCKCSSCSPGRLCRRGSLRRRRPCWRFPSARACRARPVRSR